jgi:pyruvate/2-oxoglutarate dehydrogenase complex dihydrolipoamide acyltransferase (E2) component
MFPKDNVDICCLVAVGDGNDLANTTIRKAETKDLKQICNELKDAVDKLRARKSVEHNKKMNIVNILPTL